MGLLNSCRFTPTLGGTTDWTYSITVPGFQSPAAAGGVNGTPYSVRSESADGSQWEDAQGNYNSATGTFARTTVLYNSSGTGTGAGQTGAGTKINFTTVPQVQVVALAEDLAFAPLASPTFTGTPTAPTAAANDNSTKIATTAYVVGQAGTANPIMNGAVAVGTSLLYARQDHVHPSDTSRAPTASPVFTGTLSSANQTITSASANATTIGPNGLTNPTLNVDSSTVSSATGLNIKSAAAAAGLALAVLSSGANENLTISAKGTGTITLGSASTGAIVHTPPTTLSAALTYGGVTLANAVTGTGNMVLSANPVFTGTLSSANQTITSTSANANAVGPAGTTNPTFNVDSSTASAATGLNIKSAAAAAGLALSVLSSGTNENLTINAKGTGTITFGSASTGAIIHTPPTTLSAALTYGGVALANSVTGTGSMALSISPTFTGTVTAPLLAGGSAVSSTLTLQSTTAAGTSDLILLKTGSQVERLRVDNLGQFTINNAGSTSLTTGIFLNIYTTDGTNHPGFIAGYQQSNDAVPGYIVLRKSRGTTVGSFALVANNDKIGELAWDADIGTAYLNCAIVSAEVDAAPVSGQRVAGRLMFKTSIVNTAVTERMRIDSTGQIIANQAGASSVLGSFFTAYSVDGVNNPGFLTGYQQSADAAGGYIQLNKSRGTTVGSHAVLQSNDVLGAYGFGGDDGTNIRSPAFIQAVVDGSPTSGQRLPARMSFYTGVVNTAPAERVRIDNGGGVFVISVGTTASAANAFINNASSPVNQLLRSTSSLRYKKDVEPVADTYRDAVLAIKPIWYRSKCAADDPTLSFYGMAAEEVAAIDPRLCHWAYCDEDYDTVVVRAGDRDEGIERILKPGSKLVPDAVMYERVAILQIAALAAKISALEQRMKS
jgi:hypothetical protein